MAGFNDLLEEDKKKKSPLRSQVQDKAEQTVEGKQEALDNNSTLEINNVGPLRQKVKDKAEEKVQQREESIEKYGRDLSPEVLNAFNEHCANSENPLEEAARISSSLDYMDLLGVSFDEAYANLDIYLENWYGDTEIKSYKPYAKQLRDVVITGANNYEMGLIGKQIMDAELAGNTELAEVLLKKYNTYKADNEIRADSTPLPFYKQMFKDGLGSLAYTGYSGLFAGMGNFILPGAGTALSFKMNKDVTAGQKYMELRDYVPVTAAATASKVDGFVESLIETSLGTVAQFAGIGLAAGGSAITDKFTNTALRKTIDTIGKKFRMSPGFRQAFMFLADQGKDITEEGVEEVLQNLWGEYSTLLAEQLSGVDIQQKDITQILNETKDAFWGGVTGAIVLGIIPTGVNTALQTREYFNIKKDAETNPSEALFVKQHEDTNIFGSELSKEEKREELKKLYEDFAPARDEAWTKRTEEAGVRSVEDIKESNASGAGYIQPEVDQETGEEIPAEIYRDEKGNLHTETEVSADGETETFKVGDPTKDGPNLHASMTFSRDEDNNTITIEKFDIPVENEAIRQEVFENFAKENPGYDIKWDPKYATAKEIKKNLIAANPRGKEYGLNYYKNSTEVEDAKVRNELTRQARELKNIPEEEIPQFVAYTETLIKNTTNMSLSEAINTAFNTDENGELQVIKAVDDYAENVANAAGRTFNGPAGENSFYKTAKGVTLTDSYKKIIYVGQHGDVGTLCHEMLHAITPFFNEETKAEAEKLLGKSFNDWGREENEQLATWLESYLTKGETPNSEAKNFLNSLAASFCKIVEYVHKYLGDELSDDILKFYDKMLAGNDEILNQAMRTLEDQNRVQESRAIQQQIQEENQRREARLNKETKEELTPEQQHQENTEQVLNINTEIPEAVNQDIANIINDETSSIVEKDKVMDFAVDTQINIEDGLFQIYKGIVDRANPAIDKPLQKTMNNSLKGAIQFMEEGKKSSRKIREETGWSKGKNTRDEDVYVFETNDYVMEIVNKNLLTKIKTNPQLLIGNKYPLNTIVKNEEVFNLSPWAQTIPVKFTNDNSYHKVSFKANEINVNLNKLKSQDLTDKGFKAIMSMGIQYAIMSKEGNNVEKMLSDNEKAIDFIVKADKGDIETLAKIIKKGKQASFDELNLIFNNNILQRAKIAAGRLLQEDTDYLSFLSEDLENLIDNDFKTREKNLNKHFDHFDNLLKNEEIKNKVENEIRENPELQGLFQELTPEQIETAKEYLKTFPKEEQERINKNLETLEGTGWQKQAIISLNTRHDMLAAMNGEEVSEDSILRKDSVKGAFEAIKKGEEGIFNYLTESTHSMLGAAAKPVNAISSSLLNCNPSSECAKFCYATKGNYIYAGPIVKSEMVNWAVEANPIKAAEIAAAQYKGMAEYIYGQAALRVFDKGDISEKWLDFINEMNKRGVRLQIFSKRPEILRKVDGKKNLILLSIDKSNTYLADENPDLPIALVYSGREDLKFLEENKERFLQHGGVILPVKLNNRILAKEEIDALPKWTGPYNCPIDTGMKKIGTKENEWNCTKCDKKGTGCFYHQKQLEKQEKIKSNILEFDKGELDELFKQIQREATEQLNLTGDQSGQLLSLMVNISRKTLAGYDLQTEDGSVTSFKETNGSGRTVEERSSSGSTEAGGPEINPDGNPARDTEGLYQEVTDTTTLKWLEQQETVKAYRAVQIHNGHIYPPMAAKINGKWANEIKLEAWEQSEENPDLVVQQGPNKGKFKLDKGNGKSIYAAYDPYLHSSNTMLNDQLAESQDRPELAVIEVEIPMQELYGEDRYHAPLAKYSTGVIPWKAGVIQSQLTGTRNVNLSRYDKPIRIVPNEEVAENIMQQIDGHDIVFPSNVVTPAVRAAMEKLGAKFIQTNNRGYIVEGENVGKHYSKVYGKNKDLFQDAYHGTSQSFDKFDTDNYGLSGEGSMSFGYGAYVTGSEEIGRDYATRQYNEKTGTGIQYMLEAAIASRDEQQQRLADLGTFENWTEKNNAAIEERKKQIEDLKKKGKVSKWKEKLLEIQLNNNNIENYNKEKANIEGLIKSYEDEIAKLEEDKKTAEANKATAQRTLLTVKIPDSGFIKWDQKVKPATLNKIKNGLYRKLAYEKDSDGYIPYAGAEAELKKELDEVFSYEYDGARLYGTVASYLGSEKNASKFLSSLGYAGNDYPAGTNFGNGHDARNYVIFNDEDAVIIDRLLFQTRQELYDDARRFSTWEDFMDFYTAGFDFEKLDNDPTYHNQVPGDADAQWYQTTWELANGLKSDESMREEEVQEKYKNDGTTAAAMDALFTSNMANNPQMLDDFLVRIAEIEGTDLETDYAQVEDEEDAADRDRIQMLQDYIGTQLTHGNWLSNAQRVRNGDTLTAGARNRILGLIRSNPRSYRAIYAEIMEDESYAVDEQDTMAQQLAGKLKRYKLVSPDEDVERINPERMKKLADEISNIEVASKIKNGSIKMGNELDNYLKSLRKQITDQEKEFNELEKETQADYQRIADAEKRDLLKLYEKLLKARSEYNIKNDEVTRKMDKGIKISKKYERDSENLRANYNEIFRKFKDLEQVIRIDAEVQAAMKRREQVQVLRDSIKDKKKEQHVVEQVKHLRVQLVKRVMRRVPFDKIDYENAKTLIAIQRVLEPNLMGGVNRWIGTEGPHIRYVVTGILTDADYKEDLMHYLRKRKQTPGLMKFIDKLENTKSIDEIDSWTKGERLAALRYLPKEDWIKDLNLKQLAKEREESIDLDIDTIPKQVDMVDSNGKVIIDKATGEPYKITTWEVKASPDIEERIRDAVGIDMYNNIITRPFAEWTTNEMTELAQIINNLYKEGRDDLAAKRQVKKEAAAAIRRAIENTTTNTGIVINEDDDDETKKRKQAKIDKILGIDSFAVKGTNDSRDSGMFVKANRLLHGYYDANVRRVARILDNLGEGVNTNQLYWKENEAYTAKQRSINARAENIQKVMKDNNISIEDLAKEFKIQDMTFTLDELLYFLAADKDFQVDEKKYARNGGLETDLANNDDYAATSRNAVMYGNMLSGNAWIEFKEQCKAEDEEMQRRIDADELTTSEREAQILGMFISRPGTANYISKCKTMFAEVMKVANALDDKYKKLLEAIEADYTSQYERMNEVSINEFNAPVHRVKNYVPLVRLESNGDTNANQVKEDLLGTMGGQSRQYVNKGMTQRRVNQGPLHQKPVQTGLYKTWSNSVERTEHFIAYAPYVRELNAIYKSRDAEMARRKIENRYGKPMLRYIDDYINEVANPNANKVRNAGDELLRTLRGKTAPAYLAWKASAIIKQGLTSPWPYMRFIDPAHYLAASWKCIASRGQMYEVIRQKSVFMNNRVMDPMNDLIDEMADTAKNKFDRAIGNFNKKGMAGLEWIDWISVAPGWLACYEQEYARVSKANETLYAATKAKLQEENDLIDFTSPDHLSESQIEAEAQKALIDPEKAAVDYADDCTRQCQPSNRSVDIAPLFKNSSEAMKAYLQFQTSLNVIWQNLRYDIPYDIRNKAGWRIAGTILGYTLAGIFMNSVMEGYDGGDDDDKEKIKQAIYYATTQFTDAVPMIGSELTNTMDKLITGKQQFMSTGTDMTPTVSKFLAILTNAKKGNWQKAAEMTAEGIGMSLGLPVSGTKEIKKILINDKKKKVEVNLGKVYGILDNIFDKEEE